MSIEKTFTDFTKRITLILQQKSNLEQLAVSSAKLTAKTIEKISSSEGKIKNFASFQNMSFTDIDSKLQFYGTSKQSFNDLNDSQFHLYKLQLQWLLVNAYEYFEMYLKTLYADCYKIPNLWKLEHFGSLTFQDLSQIKDDVIVNKASKIDPKVIINIFRNKLHDFSRLEISNSLNVNFKFFIKITEKFRHIVVHNNGYVNDMTKFESMILKEIGCSPTSNEAKELRGTLTLFFDQDNFIDLRKIRGHNIGPFPTHHCKFSVLIDKMMCLSDLLRRELIAYQN